MIPSKYDRDEPMRTVLIIAHGSKEDRNGNAAQMQAERMEKILGTRVIHVFKNCNDNELRAALSYLSEGDVDQIVVIPLFFASGMFSEKMVPRKLGLDEGVREGTIPVDGRLVDVRIGTPFGNDSHMRDVISQVLERESAEAGKTAVMMIGHGSKDGANSKAVEYNAEIVRGLGYDAFPCYNEMIEPTVEDALSDIMDHGFSDILVIPLFVSSSHHSVVEIPEKLGLVGNSRERAFVYEGRNVSIRYSREIGLESGIAEILCGMVRGERSSINIE